MLGCDVAALMGLPDFFWQAAALLSGAGVAFGALAAMFGAMELERVKDRPTAKRKAHTHAILMGSAWIAGLIALIGRVEQDFSARLPPPIWVVAVDGLVVVALLAGAFFGGELVYRHGVGVQRED